MFYLFGPHSPASDLKIVAVTAEVKGGGESADELGGMLRVNACGTFWVLEMTERVRGQQTLNVLPLWPSSVCWRS